MAAPHAKSEIRWILDTLRTSMRLLDVTNRLIESEMGWSHGYLSRIFSGTIELRVEHVLEIAALLGLKPAEFFDLAYPRRPDPPSPNAARLQSLLRRYQPEAPRDAKPIAGVDDGDLAQLVEKLRDHLRQVGRAG
jgi:hypothetical protein